MDFGYILKYLPLYIDAAKLTVSIGVAGIVLSIIIGFITSYILYLKIPILKSIANVYVEVSRNTPLLVQMFFIYYGLPKVGIRTNPVVCGVLGLAFLGGGYMTESLRSGLETINKSQVESSLSLGLSMKQVMIYVLYPQAISISMPSIVANVIFLLKETSVFSAISLMDLMFTTKDLISLYYKTTESLVMLVIFYMIILFPISFIGSVIERRIRYV